jgi:hypothetical protein
VVPPADAVPTVLVGRLGTIAPGRSVTVVARSRLPSSDEGYTISWTGDVYGYEADLRVSNNAARVDSVVPTSITIHSTYPYGRVGIAYEAALEIRGGVPPYTVEVIEGQIPPGLVLERDGRIHGTPTATTVRDTLIGFRVRDARGDIREVSQPIWIRPELRMISVVYKKAQRKLVVELVSNESVRVEKINGSYISRLVLLKGLTGYVISGTPKQLFLRKGDNTLVLFDGVYRSQPFVFRY